MGQLDGVKVVELATFIAAPSCARILASYGADVIKVEAPRGDDLRAAGRQYYYPAPGEDGEDTAMEDVYKRHVLLSFWHKVFPWRIKAIAKLQRTTA